MSLTDKAIRALKPQNRPYRVSDGSSLYVLVQPTGAKHWVYRYRFAGKETTLSYGVYPEVSAAEARKRHLEARQAVKAGRNVSADRQAAKARQRLDAANSFKAVATEWLEGRKHTLAAVTYEKAERNFKTLVYGAYLDLSWSEAVNGPLGTSFRRIEAKNQHPNLNALLAGAHPREVAWLKAMVLKARDFRVVDRELRDAKNELETLLKTFGLLDARSDPRRRKARKKN